VYVSGVLWRSHASPAIPAVPIHDRTESISSAGVGGLQAAARTNETISNRFARI
jgi:hypothetical protein